MANGLLNRFLVLYVSRPRMVPLPRPTPEAKIEELAERVADAVMAVTRGELHADNMFEVTMSEAASELWEQQYPVIARDREGRPGSLMARSEMYARMLAMIFAVMDSRLIIEPRDFDAAFAWVQYWNASVNYAFKFGDDDGRLDPLAEKVLEIIRVKPGIARSELPQRCKTKDRKKIEDALRVLLALAPPLIEERIRGKTGGRPAQTYYVL
jgi:putative DNA primase/helicase